MRSYTDISIFGLNFPPEPTGTAPYTGALASGLRRLGYAVTAHAGHPHYPEWRVYRGYGQWNRDDRIDGVAVRRRLHYVPHHPHGIRRLVSELTFGLRVTFTHWDVSRAIVVVSPAMFSSAMVVLRALLTPRRPPVVVWVQDIYALGMSETKEGISLAAKLTSWVEGHVMRAADRVVVIHPRFARYAVDVLGVKPENLVVVRNWDHLPAAAPVDSTSAKWELGWPTDATLVVHTGNMGVKQGLENVVDAARLADERHAPVHFVLVGDGCQREKLMARARGISRLTFVDTLSDDDYHLALSAADVLLVNEMTGVAAMAVPSKLTSYFHAGRPVIAATDPEGICAEEVATSGAGIVVAAGQPDTLLDTVLALSADPVAAEELGANGRRYRMAALDERVAIEQWGILIGDIVENGHQRAGRIPVVGAARPRDRIRPLSAQYPPAS
jgi:glycosyltransferase involved in cell wall biosynthesis